METLSGVKHKLYLITACLFLAGFLTACGDHREEQAFFDTNEAQAALAQEVSSCFAKGFASDLCVYPSEKDSLINGIDAEAYALFDVSDPSIRTQKNIYEKVYPASTTKILTCLLALELCDPEEEVLVPQESAITVSGSSMADLKPGDTLKMKDMLYALMVPSGNDAAAAIAVHISGSIDEFADLMNRKAKQLGATRSHFTNPHGLPDEEHYTCVYDLYLIFNEASKNEKFREIASTASYTAQIRNNNDQETREVTWTSGNGFYNGKFSLKEGLDYYGGKTGHTNAAGYCLVLGGFDTAGREFISVVMKADGYDQLYNGTKDLTSQF